MTNLGMLKYLCRQHILMSVLTLPLLNVLPQARADHNFVQPTTNNGYCQDFFIFPALVSLLYVLHIFGGKLSVFFKTKVF